MGTLNPNIPNAELARLMTEAAGKMAQYRLKLLTPQLLLRSFLAVKDSAAYRILHQLSRERGVDLAQLERRAEQMAQMTPGRDAHFFFTDDFGKDIPLSEEMLVVLDEALSLAQSRDELKTGSGHALAAMCMPQVTTSGALQQMGVTMQAVVDLLDEAGGEQTPVLRDFLAEAMAGRGEAVYQRDALLQELMTLLATSGRRHVILVGPEGAGKRTLVYSLALVLAEDETVRQALGLRSLVKMNEAALLENPLAAMRAGLRRASGGALLVPDIDRFFADRLHAVFPEQVNRELHKALLGDEQVVIGTATPGAYDLLVEERIIRQRVNRLTVPAMSREETLAILRIHKSRLEAEYGLVVDDGALAVAVTLADQYVKTIAMPTSAIQLMERTCATVRVLAQAHEAVLPEVASDGRLDGEDVMYAASQMTGIPVAKLGRDERSRYANMVEHLHERIIGQEEAVLAVSRAVKTARVGLRDPRRPIGSFLFLGPSGVGKSELAKALAEFLFGSEEAMLVLDMSEYQDEASLNRLIGAPPGYVGFEGGGQLTDFVRERPYTVVLFDEVEKAHPRVLDVLLQVMEEGRLTDGQGRVATFSEAVIILTSNLGAYHMLVPIIGERERELVMAEVRRFFRPEFLNRLDEIILFHQLTPDQLAQILDLMLRQEMRLAAGQGIELEVAPPARRWLLGQNDQPEYGARPLRRIIARNLREPLANFLLSQGEREEETRVVVNAAATGLTFEMEPVAAS